LREQLLLLHSFGRLNQEEEEEEQLSKGKRKKGEDKRSLLVFCFLCHAV
jgi:hypothetical protein